MRDSKRVVVVCAALGLPFAAASARADEPKKLEAKAPEYVIDKPAPPKKAVDWRLILGSEFSLDDNRSVVGQTDGTSVTFAYKLDLLVDWAVDDHEWRNSFVVGAGMTRSPAVDDLVKARDSFVAESIYLYHAESWVGPFVRAAIEGAAFAGYDVRPAPVSYLISHVDGTTETIVDHKLQTTDGFRPLLLKQSVGVFFQPVDEEAAKLELRAALGGREHVAKGQYAVDDDAATSTIEVTELASSQELGAEATLALGGSAADHRLSYAVTAEALVPFLHSELAPDDDRGVAALTTLAFGANLSVNIVDWASVDYDFKAVREPLVIDTWQIQNNLVLTLGLTVPVPKPPADECKK